MNQFAFVSMVVFGITLFAAPIHAQQTANQPAPKNLAQATKEVQSAQKIMAERLAQLRQAAEAVKKPLSAFNPGDVTSNKLTLAALQKLIAKHLEIVDILEKTRPDFEQSWARFQGALESTPAGYRSLAEAYEKRGHETAKAKGDASDFYSKQYFDWAKRCREVAASFEAEAAAWQLIHDKVEEKLAFVAHSREFLHDLGRFLAIYEKANQNRDDVAAYLQLLDGYVTNFKSTLKIFEEFSNKLKVPPSTLPALPTKVSQIQKTPPAPGSKHTMFTSTSSESRAPNVIAKNHYKAGKAAEARGDLATAKSHYRAAIAGYTVAIANLTAAH